MKKLFLLPLLMVFLFSCQEKKGTTTTTDSTATESDSTTQAFTALRDSTNKAWEIMMADDDKKIANMKRLLLEISYCKKYNAMRLDSITKAVNGLDSARYKQLTMTSEQIDAYDDQTTKIIDAIRSLAQSTKELPSHPIAEELYNDIARADGDVARYRTLYDRNASLYNAFIAKNKEALKAQGELKPLPLFAINPA
jgi:hypothetical protein